MADADGSAIDHTKRSDIASREGSDSDEIRARYDCGPATRRSR